jgi:hypothetical protein
VANISDPQSRGHRIVLRCRRRIGEYDSEVHGMDSTCSEEGFMEALLI